MFRSLHIALILPDTFQRIGMQNLLTDYFSPLDISCYPTFEAFSTPPDTIDYYVVSSDTFIINADFFLPRRNKTIILTGETSKSATSGCLYIYVRDTQENIIEQLQLVFNSENNGSLTDSNKELSARETDVLQLIVTGITNKEIADKLNISLNTVLTHRKNITSKLGIKTVSGLTFYAIMNGLISGDEIAL